MPILSRFSFSAFRPLLVSGVVIGASLPACRTSYWSKKADDDVYGILEKKELMLFGKKVEFDINTPHSAKDPKEIEAISIINSRKDTAARHIDLDDALNLFVLHRREYQTEKENLYLTGLALTRARYNFTPQFGASSEAALDTVTQRAGDGVARDESQQGSIRSRAGFDQLFKTGGTLAVDVAQDIFRFYLGGGDAPTTGFFSATLTQPLLRGRGKVATENLTQSERDVSYAIRSFTRYQKATALSIITDYCRILQEKDRVRNEYSNYRNIIAFTERATELAKDRLPRFQVDQARQDELRARNRYIVAVNSYRNRIDDFKLTLGIPIGDEITIDDNVLRTLEKAGLPAVSLSPQQALDLAVDDRLDFLNEIDRFEDAKRRIEVAADAFKPGLNLFASANLSSRGSNGRTSYSNFNPDIYRTRIGIDLDLPLDNMDARNSFRRAEINFDRQLRQLSLALDQMNSNLREGLRGLELARQSFEIQKNALQLANQRVEATNLLLEADRAETRDLLEARNDQLTARNALTSALIDYHLTRLNFLHNLGVFDPNDSDFWTQNPKGTDSRNISPTPPVDDTQQELVTPDELFQETSPKEAS
ncbi:TolC family protein [Luteolibacter pohnpeiensis]|uniref:TolC family protein n=1 Tax=Luteolibacter pohnpeiensis TaxID=454153 RepID=A0A934VV84_9BACT|nr:TolC family protein [Luteolibacter pohnpeiensis]MBK1881528.1 TolC family protein [Luteolibacter pohnpeiensis]